MPNALPPDLHSLIQKHLALGNYASEEDVLRDAMQALDRQREIMEDIEVGLADLEAGRGRSLEDIDAQLREKHNIPRVL